MGDAASWLLPLGLSLVYAALGFGVITVLRTRRTVSADRRRPTEAGDPGQLAKFTAGTVNAINRGLRGRDLRYVNVSRLQRAGLKVQPSEFLLMTLAAGLVLGVLGFVVGGLGAGVLFGLLGFAIMPVGLSFLAARRASKFADQLPDTLQMLAGSMRAGHSLLRAIDNAAGETPAPMGEELARVVAETRVGRDLNESLLDVMGRTNSQDFLWVAQAIEVHREVGGDLAEVIDNVNETIRDRNQLERQVRAISAEGRVSAYVLIALPIFMFIALNVVNPNYAKLLTTTLPGWLMLILAAVQLTLGSFWMSRLIKPKF